MEDCTITLDGGVGCYVYLEAGSGRWVGPLVVQPPNALEHSSTMPFGSNDIAEVKTSDFVSICCVIALRAAIGAIYFAQRAAQA